MGGFDELARFAGLLAALAAVFGIPAIFVRLGVAWSRLDRVVERLTEIASSVLELRRETRAQHDRIFERLDDHDRRIVEVRTTLEERTKNGKSGGVGFGAGGRT